MCCFLVLLFFIIVITTVVTIVIVIRITIRFNVLLMLQDTMYYLPAEAHALGWQQHGLADRLYARASGSSQDSMHNTNSEAFSTHPSNQAASDNSTAPEACQPDSSARQPNSTNAASGEDCSVQNQVAVDEACSVQNQAASGGGCSVHNQATSGEACSVRDQAASTTQFSQAEHPAVTQSVNATSSSATLGQDGSAGASGEDCSVQDQAASTTQPSSLGAAHSAARQSATATSSSASSSQDDSAGASGEQQGPPLFQDRPYQLPEPFVQRPRIGSRLFVQSHFPGIAAALASEMVSWQTDMRIRLVSHELVFLARCKMSCWLVPPLHIEDCYKLQICHVSLLDIAYHS